MDKLAELKRQIAEDAADENAFAHAGLCEAGFRAEELQQLALSHTELLEAAKRTVAMMNDVSDSGAPSYLETAIANAGVTDDD